MQSRKAVRLLFVGLMLTCVALLVQAERLPEVNEELDAAETFRNAAMYRYYRRRAEETGAPVEVPAGPAYVPLVADGQIRDWHKHGMGLATARGA